jgi:LysR family glycine cleavage system transcriptional activator
VTWQIPSIAALRTFEAASRHMSFTKAAEELHVTQSAVSRQVAQTEEYLGLLLFQRVRKRLVLTEAGQQYAGAVRKALEQMQAATVALRGHKGGGTLNIATGAAFATRWLIPRLARFNQSRPDIVVTLSTRDIPFDLEREGFDAAFHFGSSDWPGVVAEPLGGGVSVVCSPEYLAGRHPLRTAGDLRHHVLLQHTRRPDQWRHWFEAAGVTGVDPWVGPRFEHYYMVTQAVLAHLGFGLVPTLLVQDDLVSGRLVDPLNLHFAGTDTYCLVYPPAKKNDARLEQFRRWLRSEAAPERAEAKLGRNPTRSSGATR